MSTKKNNLSTKAKVKSSKTSQSRSAKNQPVFLFSKKNYYLMLIGLGMIVLGFLLMIGGDSKNPHVFNSDEIYSFRRITLAPILIIAGFVVEVFAIMIKPKEDKSAF